MDCSSCHAWKHTAVTRSSRARTRNLWQKPVWLWPPECSFLLRCRLEWSQDVIRPLSVLLPSAQVRFGAVPSCMTPSHILGTEFPRDLSQHLVWGGLQQIWLLPSSDMYVQILPKELSFLEQQLRWHLNFRNLFGALGHHPLKRSWANVQIRHSPRMLPAGQWACAHTFGLQQTRERGSSGNHTDLSLSLGGQQEPSH